MAFGVTTQGPLMPCMPGLRFVSAPTFRRASTSSPTSSVPLRDCERQMTPRELDSWNHMNCSSRSNAKPVVDTRTGKWSGSSEQYLMSTHYRQTRHTRGPYRGQIAHEREAVSMSELRICDHDRILATTHSQNNMIGSACTGASLFDESVSQSTFWLEASDKPVSTHSGWLEQAGYSRRWSAYAADIDTTASRQRGEQPHQTVSRTLQNERNYPLRPAFDSNSSTYTERADLNRTSTRVNLYAQGFVQSEISKHSGQVSREIEHISGRFPRNSLQNNCASELGVSKSETSFKMATDQSSAFAQNESQCGELRSFHDGGYSRWHSDKPRNYTAQNVAGDITSKACGAPQKLGVQPRQKLTPGSRDEVNPNSPMLDIYLSERQEYSAMGKRSTSYLDSTFNRRIDSSAMAQTSKFESRVEAKDSRVSQSQFSGCYPKKAVYRGQSVSKEDNLHSPESQSSQRQISRLDALSFQNSGKLKSESSSSWREEGKKIKAIRMRATANTGVIETDLQHKISHSGPVSGTEVLSSVSKRGRGSTDGMSTLKVVVSDDAVQVQNLENTVVEKDSLVKGSVARQMVGNSNELSKSIAVRSNGVSGEQNLEHTLDGQKTLHKTSMSRQVESSEKVERYLEGLIRTGCLVNESGTDRVSSNNSIQGQSEKLILDSADKKGRVLYTEKGGSIFSRENGHLQHCTVNEDKKGTLPINGKHIRPNEDGLSACSELASRYVQSKGDDVQEKFNHLYKKVFIVDKVETARMVVGKLMGEYKHLIHACDTEVANIDVKKDSPVGHGRIICFSIYCGPQADFGNGKSCVWVDVLDGGEDVLTVFAPYFEDSSIRKVWHNYSFDSHIIGNHGINVSGFHADTMHLARLWNSARSGEGGYSLEALTKDPRVMDGAGTVGEDDLIAGKVSMKTIFGKKKIKKDGSEGKIITTPPVEEIQRTERIPWICYSALDSISTLKLWESLREKLKCMDWVFQGVSKGNMYDFYQEYWRPFGELLVQMESEGMLIDREYLSKMEEIATKEQADSGSRFRKWASKYCLDACYMNVGSDAQVRQLLFGGMCKKKDRNERLPLERTFKVPNVDNFIEEGKKSPLKFRNIVLRGVGVNMCVEIQTPSGWPAVNGAALKLLAGKVSAVYNALEEDNENEFPVDMDEGSAVLTSEGVKVGEKTAETEAAVDLSVYGTAYHAFGGGQRGREACHAIAALCEVSSINTLISNFLQPLQGNQISGQDGRVHCSLNINTETGRLSARRPNLQNQPALEKDRYKIRQAFIAKPGNLLIVADYGQLELRILAHLSNCKSMLDAFSAGGDFHSRTAVNMYTHVRDAVEKEEVLLEPDAKRDQEKAIPLLKDVFAVERRKAKMLNFSIAYGKTVMGLAKDWKVTMKEAEDTVSLWYKERQEVLQWQEERKNEACTKHCVYTLLGRARHFPDTRSAKRSQKHHIERAAINTPVQGSAADVAMCAMLQISRNDRLKELGWKLLLQVHDEVILEGPEESAEEAKSLVVECMSKPFYGKNILGVDLVVDAKFARDWYSAK
eukprot:Gb_07861 [translate_table: standard]